jgi:hypothetical protein
LYVVFLDLVIVAGGGGGGGSGGSSSSEFREAAKKHSYGEHLIHQTAKHQ